ncbi:hypothetical protein ABH926_008811 [Catenulispora sp. GP43]|uniref:DUF317 domain-containing protein n=1 Tax=Catenulispora sp. GP43 TaxID=3156263 RepID=UPI0035166F14
MKATTTSAPSAGPEPGGAGIPEHLPAAQPQPTPLLPLCAAGAGLPDTALREADAMGWTGYHDTLGDVMYVSPDGQMSVEFGPENDAAAIMPLWRVSWRNPDPYRPRERSWTPHFSSETPAEAIAAFLNVFRDHPPAHVERWG